MKNKKIILLSIISFLTIALSLLIKSNITYGNEETVYNFDDLKVGDYLPFGATVQVNEDYYETKNQFSGVLLSYYNNGVNITILNRVCFNGLLNCDSTNYKSKFIPSNTMYILKNYNEYFPNGTDNYIGFEIVKIKNNTIILYPISDYSKINKTPSEDNNYNIDTYFPNTNKRDIENTWYKINNITNYQVSEEDFWKNDNNTLHFLYKGGKQLGDTITLAYSFNANAGDIVKFKTRSWCGASWYSEKNPSFGDSYDSYEITFNGIKIKYPTNYIVRNINDYSSNYYNVITATQDTALYEYVYLKISKSGEQKLTFTYQINGSTVSSDTITLFDNKSYEGYITYDVYPYNYAYIKDLVLLTKINDGTQLDTSKVSDGDNLYYESVDKNGHVLSESLTYQIPETLPEENNTNEANPNTKDLKLIIYIVVIISSIILLYEYRKLKWLK